MDMDVGVKIDSPTPMKALGIAMLINPLAAPVNAVKILHSRTPNPINLGLLYLSASVPMNNPIIE